MQAIFYAQAYAGARRQRMKHKQYNEETNVICNMQTIFFIVTIILGFVLHGLLRDNMKM